MNNTESLQKAICKSIESGYQLNREAFEFLSKNTLKEDPITIINKVLEKISYLDKKPIFIDKNILEQIIDQSENNCKDKKVIIKSNADNNKFETLEPEVLESINEKFNPPAKNIKSEIRILENPSKSLSSNGTIEDYIQYFQDRFRRIEKLLRQRIDVKSATTIKEANRQYEVFSTRPHRPNLYGDVVWLS